jgi:HPt (histidine-containing phosphotransfer) domain-containing protein
LAPLAEQPIWRLDRLAEVSLGLPVLKKQLVVLLRDHTQKTIDQLTVLVPTLPTDEEAAARTTLSTIRGLAHDIKGSALNIGLERLGWLAARMTTAAFEGDHARVQVLHALLLPVWQDVLHLIDIELNKLLPDPPTRVAPPSSSSPSPSVSAGAGEAAAASSSNDAADEPHSKRLRTA